MSPIWAVIIDPPEMKTLFLALLTSCLLAATLRAGAGEATVAHPAGMTACPEEFHFYQSRLQTHVAGDEELQRETWQAIARARAIQELAVSLGILDSVSTWPDLVQEFNAGNLRREQMKARGEVFYGPVRFRQEVWFAVWQEQLIQAIRQHAPGARDPQIPRPEREAAAREWTEARIRAAAGRLLGNNPS